MGCRIMYNHANNNAISLIKTDKDALNNTAHSAIVFCFNSVKNLCFGKVYIISFDFMRTLW